MRDKLREVWISEAQYLRPSAHLGHVNLSHRVDIE